MSEPTLRPAIAADLPQIIALDQEIFGVYGAQEDPAIIAARLAVFPQGCAVMEEPAAAGAGVNLLGYITTEKWATVREPALDEDPRLTHQPDGRILNITTLAVNPAHHNRGLGGQLLNEVIRIARREGCAQIILETARAEAFYRKHGFSKLGERRQREILLYVMHYVVGE